MSVALNTKHLSKMCIRDSPGIHLPLGSGGQALPPVPHEFAERLHRPLPDAVRYPGLQEMCIRDRPDPVPKKALQRTKVRRTPGGAVGYLNKSG